MRRFFIGTATSEVLGLLFTALALRGCGGKASEVSDAAAKASTDDSTSAPTADAGSDGAGSGGSGSGSGSGASGSDGSSGGGSSSGSSNGGSASGSSGGGSSGGTGATGEPCSGTSCSVGNTCVAIGGVSECQACGGPGQVCCTTMPTCANAAEDWCAPNVWKGLGYCINNGASTTGQPGEPCATTCTAPTYACVSGVDPAYCLTCGGLGNPCCGTTCEAGLSCTSGTCQ